VNFSEPPVARTEPSVGETDSGAGVVGDDVGLIEAVDGVGLDGVGLDGVVVDNVGLDGVVVDGVGLDGVVVDNVGPDGVVLDGVWEDDVWQYGAVTSCGPPHVGPPELDAPAWSITTRADPAHDVNATVAWRASALVAGSSVSMTWVHSFGGPSVGLAWTHEGSPDNVQPSWRPCTWTTIEAPADDHISQPVMINGGSWSVQADVGLGELLGAVALGDLETDVDTVGVALGEGLVVGWLGEVVLGVPPADVVDGVSLGDGPVDAPLGVGSPVASAVKALMDKLAL